MSIDLSHFEVIGLARRALPSGGLPAPATIELYVVKKLHLMADGRIKEGIQRLVPPHLPITWKDGYLTSGERYEKIVKAYDKNIAGCIAHASLIILVKLARDRIHRFAKGTLHPAYHKEFTFPRLAQFPQREFFINDDEVLRMTLSESQILECAGRLHSEDFCACL